MKAGIYLGKPVFGWLLSNYLKKTMLILPGRTPLRNVMRRRRTTAYDYNKLWSEDIDAEVEAFLQGCLYLPAGRLRSIAAVRLDPRSHLITEFRRVTAPPVLQGHFPSDAYRMNYEDMNPFAILQAVCWSACVICQHISPFYQSRRPTIGSPNSPIPS
jgi:hypothetical protein